MDSRTIDDETRRTLLKSLGVAGSVAVGSASLGQVRAAMATPERSESLASTGAALHDELGDSLDAEALRDHAESFAAATRHLGTIHDAGVPEERREDFLPVAEAGRPIVDHLVETGFYERTNEELPNFDTNYVSESVNRFASESALAAPLEELGFEDGDGVDLLASVSDKKAELQDQHWIGTDAVTRKMVGYGEHVPAMTRGADEGSLLWLQDLDTFLWQNAVLVTEDIYTDAVWYARAMAAGFHLVTHGAIAAAEEEDTYDDEQLAALLSVGFAIQAICDPTILQEVYWIRDGERAPRRSDLEPAEVQWR